MSKTQELSVNKNTEYELLVKQIYEEILLDENKNDIKVEHNKQVQGKSGQFHQIDFYWECNVAGDIYRFAVECKNYSKPVSIGKIRDFHGVLIDIGTINGIFVSTSGYQAGAKKHTDYHGIILKEARSPKNEDWDGLVKTINVNINCIVPRYHLNINIIMDFDECFKNGIFKTKEEVQNTCILQAQNMHDVNIYDSNKNVINILSSIASSFQGANG